jgi:energy-coupling factor transporter transmembrane protein EcfT
MANIHSSYYPGDSILHATGVPRKIVLALACIFITGTGGDIALVVMFFLCHFGMLVSGILILDAWKRLAALKVIFFVIGVTPLFLTSGVPLNFFSELSLLVTKEGLECSIFAVSRLACMVWISMILVRTTSPQSLMEILSGAKPRFFVKSKFVQDFVLVGILSFQILPDLLAEAEQKMATSWREGTFKSKGSRLKTVKNMVQSIIIWVVEVLSDPERISRTIAKQ